MLTARELFVGLTLAQAADTRRLESTAGEAGDDISSVGDGGPSVPPESGALFVEPYQAVSCQIGRLTRSV